jgi:hypothetical protein
MCTERNKLNTLSHHGSKVVATLLQLLIYVRL